MGINSGRKEFAYDRMIICAGCGSYGRYTVYMTYTVLSLFFIPVIRWNRQYYVKSSCCGSVYRLNPEVGKRIARGENIEITPADLTPEYSGQRYFGGRRCPNCGYTTQEDFAFCPRCGSEMPR